MCRGRNIDDDLLKVKRYGAEAFHISSCHLAVYPPCPFIDEHVKHFEELLKVPLRVGTHPLPKSYVDEHIRVGDWIGLEEYVEVFVNNPEEAMKYEVLERSDSKP